MKPGCRIVGPVTIVWLTTEADDQSSLHCVIVSTDVMSDHIGRGDASRGGGCSKTSAYTASTGQFGWASMVCSILNTQWKPTTTTSLNDQTPTPTAFIKSKQSSRGKCHYLQPLFSSHYTIIHCPLLGEQRHDGCDQFA